MELIASAGSPREQRLLFDAVLSGTFDAPTTTRALAALNDAARLRKILPTGDLAPLATLLAAPATRTGALPLVGAWKLQALAPALVALVEAPATSPTDRAAAFTSLRELGGAPVITELRRLARTAASPLIRREAVVALPTS
jgi:hypothetical protein